MGVDYDAYFGIGTEIKMINFDGNLLSPFDNCKDMDDYLDVICEGGLNLKHITIGNYYSYGDLRYFVILEEPFCGDILNLKYRMENLIIYLNEIGVSNDGKVDLVGGICVS